MKASLRPIVLTGFMGSGKTTVGSALASVLSVPFYDMDSIIEEEENCSVSDIFREKGEPFFRELETALIERKLKNKGQFVLSTGGGVVMREKNRSLLKTLGTVIYLKASPKCILKNIEGDASRPLLKVKNPYEEVKRLMSLREMAYQDCDYTVNTDFLKPDKIVNVLLDTIGYKVS